ncbi:hypothetical protein GGH19_000603 [Coemansia sp. RSA 1807]|nr:hypothetical protein LPJ58_001946 [Coemansia sp. RSA 1591]KAJ1764380.1 hypothetical protein LPJ69_001880 [Coemansia sp. RSA 1752]KAJ1791397.1 hypothetical protein LPJ67_001867 [Coemansia sp. RSA 1938]KAJ1792964.1 hypothetical protein LPJ62_000527 [Coemansia sp. RSA 2167]KAJ2118496.1 hypothetical protein GGH17_005789 [Coemansia sp. RSA 788]KAJ2132356.1 hypothetical protein GGF48_000984 [Coemansia sp. RSA 921]KAJ2148352.1 hypothetical protein IW142_000967 [Coemansia sp. RSA 564]KAJ2154851.1
MAPTPPPRCEAETNGLASFMQTPVKPQQRIPQSAPPKSRTQQLLTSPEAAQRSRTSLEAFKVARALKEGFLKLKARADPSMRSPNARRALSATNSLASPRPRIARHHSELPRFGSFDSPSASRTVLAHPAQSCPQRRHILRAETRAPAPRFSLTGDHGLDGKVIETRDLDYNVTEARDLDRTEIAEAAEAMILFMKSEPSSQNEAVSPAEPPRPASSAGRGSSTETESIQLSDAESTSRTTEWTTPVSTKRARDSAPDYPASKRR